MLFALMQYQVAYCFILAVNLISLKIRKILFSCKNPKVSKSGNSNSVLHMALKTVEERD